MTGKLNNPLTGLGSEATRRLIEANRERFDAGAAERRVRDLEAALAAAQTDAANLRTRLHAVETSTSWRLTRPIRSAIKALLTWRRPAPPNDAKFVSMLPATGLRYEEWIATDEAACLAPLVRPGPDPKGRQPKPLGLVLLATSDCSHALADLLAECSGAYTVLILDQDASLGPQLGKPLEEPGSVSLAVAEQTSVSLLTLTKQNTPLQTLAKQGGVLRTLVEQGRILHIAVPPGFEPADAVGIALDRLDSDMLCFLDAGTRLAPGALALVAGAVTQQPQLDLLFGDEDWLDAAGHRTRPFFKPGWDPELQRGRDLVGPFACLRADLLRMATPSTGPGWLYDLTNQVAAAARPDRIRHIPAVLSHRITLSPGYAEAIRGAAATHLQRKGVAARVEPLPNSPGWNQVIYDLPQPAPLVSIIVPTRDNAELLRVCADGVLNGTDYPRLELLIVDNGTVELDALDLLKTLAADARVHVLRQPGLFNWSALNNAAAARASGEILVLLNNDIAVLQPDWLGVLVSHAVQPAVGAVGAKLLYPDGLVQHAGLTTDQMGIPRHLFRNADGGQAGAFGLLGLAREVWGITGACLAISRAIFFDVGGLNETFPVAYNDVEFCLRLTAEGYRIIWTPWSRVEHREMATRPPDHTEGRRDQAQEELFRLRRDWGQMILRDPFLNPNLELIHEQPCFRRNPTPLQES